MDTRALIALAAVGAVIVTRAIGSRLPAFQLPDLPLVTTEQDTTPDDDDTAPPDIPTTHHEYAESFLP